MSDQASPPRSVYRATDGAILRPPGLLSRERVYAWECLDGTLLTLTPPQPSFHHPIHPGKWQALSFVCRPCARFFYFFFHYSAAFAAAVIPLIFMLFFPPSRPTCLGEGESVPDVRTNRVSARACVCVRVC